MHHKSQTTNTHKKLSPKLLTLTVSRPEAIDTPLRQDYAKSFADVQKCRRPLPIVAEIQCTRAWLGQRAHTQDDVMTWGHPKKWQCSCPETHFYDTSAKSNFLTKRKAFGFLPVYRNTCRKAIQMCANSTPKWRFSAARCLNGLKHLVHKECKLKDSCQASHIYTLLCDEISLSSSSEQL